MANLATKLTAAALAGTFALTAYAPAAMADHRHRTYERVRIIERDYERPRHHHRRVYRDRDNTGAAIALGVGALALGAIIASQPQPAPAPVYRAPRDYYPPAPRHIGYSSLEPWSAAWYDYCADRYRSFNPSTGTYRGYDGRDHFCVAN